MRKRTLMSLIVSAGLAITLVSAMAATKTQTAGDQGDKRKRDTERATLPRQSPFACDRLALDPAARKRHFDELGPALRSMRKAVRELPDGYEFQFPSDPKSIATVAEWAAGERLCCPFFKLISSFAWKPRVDFLASRHWQERNDGNAERDSLRNGV